jgi:hypothetical protein
LEIAHLRFKKFNSKYIESMNITSPISWLHNTNLISTLGVGQSKIITADASGHIAKFKG